MDISSMSAMTAMYQNASATANSQATGSMKSSLSGISANSTEEEMKAAIKDFESYFVELIIKEMKDTFTMKNEEEKDSVMGQYEDLHMDTAIEQIADTMVDEIGGTLTQQLYEQMRRNYGLTD